MEAERIWAAYDIYGFSTLADKLQSFMGTRSPGPETDFIEVEIVGSPPRYRIGRQETGDPAILSEWIRDTLREIPDGRRPIGLIVASPATRFGDAVAAINAFHAAHLEKVDIDDLHLAPETVRHRERLPAIR